MSKKTPPQIKHALVNESISFHPTTDHGDDILININQQIRKTNLSNSNQLQAIHQGIYLLTVGNPHLNSPLRIKRLSDRAQYSLLPQQSGQMFCKLAVSQLRNYGHALTPSLGTHAHNFLKTRLPCHLIFYYHLNEIERLLEEQLGHTSLFVTEVLSNRVVMLSDDAFSYPVSLGKLAAAAIWLNVPIKQAIEKELASVAQKFKLFPELFAALKSHYGDHEWSLSAGKMLVGKDGITKRFDYASVLDDIIFARFDNGLTKYLSHFRVSDLDMTTSFPTVAVRSLVHLKARPSSLSRIENGYAIAAASECQGTQTPITREEKSKGQHFSLWMHRARRHLFRHTYRARVVLPNDGNYCAFSLVGEQVATIALFPALVKGVFETLNLETPKSVRLVAHNEDVLTIAHDTASWVDINLVNQRATSLFRIVANDGADPLSLFEQVLLPGVGVGSFQLKTVPDSFFELLDTAHSMRLTLPPGHDHYLLGLAYESLHEWGLAVEQFQKALRFDANDSDTLHALGCALMEIGRTEDALPFLKRAFDLTPEDAEVANDCGLSNMECGYLADAISAFERAVRLSPGSADYLKNLGHGYLLAARTTDALFELKKAIKCDPNFAEAHASLAHLYLAAGDDISAKKHAMLAYNQNPVDRDIANMLWRLTMGKK